MEPGSSMNLWDQLLFFQDGYNAIHFICSWFNVKHCLRETNKQQFTFAGFLFSPPLPVVPQEIFYWLKYNYITVRKTSPGINCFKKKSPWWPKRKRPSQGGAAHHTLALGIRDQSLPFPGLRFSFVIWWGPCLPWKVAPGQGRAAVGLAMAPSSIGKY